MDLDLLFRISFFIFGAMVGSFLNVCIVRWPQEKSVVFPSSHCPKCQKPIHWFDNIPIISYFALGGKCRDCGTKFSFRYAFIEFLTACVFLGFYWIFGLNWLLLPYLVMMCGFIVATFVDFEHRIIPDEVSVGGMIAGFVFSAFLPSLHAVATREEAGIVGAAAAAIVALALAVHFLSLLLQKIKIDRVEVYFLLICAGMVAIERLAFWLSGVYPPLAANALALSASLQGALIGGGLIYCMGLVGEMIFRKEAMGGGDVKLLAMIGAFLGWKLTILTFFISPFFGAVVGIVEKIRTKDSAIAYGPYLVLGAIISLFWGDLIIRWLVNGYHF
jgi:leader peptidase (prepilin peptidase)/N-methyltransferase